MRLQGKSALITGAARGIGQAFAEAYIREGARVMIGDINLDRARETAAAIGAEAVHMDVTDQASIDAAVAATAETFGGIDILINNAAIFTAAPIVEITRAEYQRVFDINVSGTLFTMQAVARHMIDAGIKEGARLVTGGTGRPEGLNRGYFVRPTVFADCNNDMQIMREEIFGPVLSMMPFDTEEEAIEIANDTDYGLTNYVQTSDGEKANRVARQLRSGMVDMNGVARSSGSPFGGYKQSGNGREGGEWGMEEFLEVKAIGGWFPDAP